jgi:hypothetical protein
MVTMEGITKSGKNSVALADASSKAIITIGTNRKFQVTEVVVTNSHATETAYVRIFDEAAAAPPTATAQALPDLIVPPLETVRLELTDGPIFSTAVSAELEGGTGTVSAYNCMVNGVLF